MGKVKLVLGITFLVFGWSFSNAQSIIKKIDYINIEQTKVRVIQREMTFELGDTLYDLEETLFEFENRIVSLGLFTKVDLTMVNDTTLQIRALEILYIWGIPKIDLADPNFAQWLQTRDFRRIAFGADVYAKNLRGLKNQLTISGLVGFNSYGTITYEKVPQGTQWNSGFFGQVGAGFRAQQKVGIIDDKLIWENRTDPYLRFANVSAGINWRAGLFNILGLSGKYEGITTKPNGTVTTPFTQADSIVDFYGLTAKYTYDRRIQQHFPVGGFFFNSKIHLKNIQGNVNSWVVPEINVKANKYHRLSKKWILKGGFVGTYQFNPAPFYFSTGLGLDRDYVRGYEPYTFVGNGYALGKISLSYGLRNNKKVKLTEKKWAKNYGTMPFSLWCSIFAENGRIIDPVLVGNTLANKNLYSIGLSLQALAYYNSTLRMDLAVNRLNRVVGNISFRNAF